MGDDINTNLKRFINDVQITGFVSVMLNPSVVIITQDGWLVRKGLCQLLPLRDGASGSENRKNPVRTMLPGSVGGDFKDHHQHSICDYTSRRLWVRVPLPFRRKNRNSRNDL